MPKIELIQGDCLEVMDELIEKGVVVDAIITDPPYGTTACKWDSVIPFDKMWERLNKLVKPNGAIALFGSQPFTSLLITSNLKMFKYEIIYQKTKATNYLQAKKQIMKIHENICIFYNNQCTYNPQFTKGEPYKRVHKSGNKEDCAYHKDTRKSGDVFINEGYRYPNSILPSISNPSGRGQLHPSQKPVALMEYLVKTYTNENETVLDFTMGSGTTGVACKNLNRNFIGIELDDKYFDIAKERINGTD